MSPLLSDERIYKETTQVVSTLITLYKKGGMIFIFLLFQTIDKLLAHVNF